MNKNTQSDKHSHAKDIHQKLNSKEALPFSDILSSAVLSKAMTQYGGDFRKRVFF